MLRTCNFIEYSTCNQRKGTIHSSILIEPSNKMVRTKVLTSSALHIFALPFFSNRAMALSTRSASASSTANANAGQSEVAIKAARDFTISQRQKLKDLGALDIQRPIRIIGEPIIRLERDDDDDDDDKKGGEAASSTTSTRSNTKIIHFQRHGQGFHNLICDIWREKGLPIDFDSSDPDLNPVIRQEFLDPPLTETGRQQCMDKREQCSLLNPELVIVSPLARCIETAKLSFQDHIPEDNNANANADADANIPWVSHEGCREELGLLVGNKRRPLSSIKRDHPFIDFSPIEHDEDVLWDEYGTTRRETLLEKSKRIYEFLVDFVQEREEKEIAIVCHSAYLFTLLNAVMDIEEEDLRYWFLTSEVRSMRVRFEKREK